MKESAKSFYEGKKQKIKDALINAIKEAMKIREGLTAAANSMGGSLFSTTGDPIGLLQPYIEDKRNIEVRYAYAAVLSDNPLGLGIERALPIY